MPANYGQGSTFEHSDKALYLNIEKEVKKYPSPRIELLKRLGSFDQPVNSHKIEWSLRDNRPVKAKVVIGGNDSATQITVDTAGVFNVDDILRKPDGEQMVVEAVSGGTQITFRHLAGTPEAVAQGDTVQRVGMATPQGKKADDMVRGGYADLYNYTSILEDVVHLSGTEHEALVRGAENSGQLIARKHKELAEVLQSQIVLGKRTKNDALKTTTMGGLVELITEYAPNNVVNFGGSGTWSSTGDSGPLGKIDDAFDIISAKVFDKPTMYVGAKFMRKFKYVLSDTSVIRTDNEPDTKGVGVVGTYLSHLYGKVKVVLIQERTGWMDDLVLLIDESDVGYKAMRNRMWQTYPLGRDGDAYRWQVLGEYTVKMGNPEAHVVINNLGV